MPRPSLRQALNSFCKACIYDPQYPGSWRMQVEDCSSKACPLFQVRPVATKAERALAAEKQALTGPK